jgi:hypothetical protein
MVFGFFACFVQGKIYLKSLFASLETRTNSKYCSGSGIVISELASLSVFGRFSSVFAPHCMDAGKIRVIVHVLGGFLYDNSNPRRFLKAFSWSKKRVTGRILTISK